MAYSEYTGHASRRKMYLVVSLVSLLLLPPHQLGNSLGDVDEFINGTVLIKRFGELASIRLVSLGVGLAHSSMILLKIALRVRGPEGGAILKGIKREVMVDGEVNPHAYLELVPVLLYVKFAEMTCFIHPPSSVHQWPMGILWMHLWMLWISPKRLLS